MNETSVTNHRSLGEILGEMGEELKQFLNTRIEIIKSELHETIAALRVAVPLGLLTLVLLGTGFLLLTAAVVAIVASAFARSPYAWFYAFLIVGFVWIAMGGIAALFAYNELRSKGMFPKRTLQVLKADKDWLESETRTKYGRAA
jgi:uncharacterized membrane protein YqjE